MNFARFNFHGMSCMNAVRDAAWAYIGNSRLAGKPQLVLPFLYSTRTIRRRPFHSFTCSAEEQSSSGTPPAIIRFTDQEEYPESTWRRNRRDDRQRELDAPGGASRLHETYETRRYGPLPVSQLRSTKDDLDEQDELPFEGRGDATSRLHSDRSSTMTDLEREAFARLFGSLSDEPDTNVDNLEQENEGDPPLFVQDVDELGKKDHYDYEIESILDRELQKEAPKLAKYPEALRGMAAKAQLQMTRNKLLQVKGRQEAEIDTTQVTITAGQDIRRISNKMARAGTDTELWAVLEQEMFDKVRALDFTEVPPEKPNKTAIKKATKKAKEVEPTGASRSPSQSLDLAVLAKVYPSVLHRAIYTLQKRGVFTPLVFALLPACKALGIFSYVLGVSTPFYNELIAYTWRFSNNLRTMITLLQEMDEVGLTLDMETWQVLENVTLYRYRAIRGDYGEGLRVAEGMSERMREGKEIFIWKREIRRRVEQAALDRVRAVDVNRRLELEEEEEIEMPSSSLRTSRHAPVARAAA